MTTVAHATLRHAERSSLREFLIEYADEFKGHVLDYGCGKQPYRDIVEAAGGDYEGYDREGFSCNVSGRDVGRDAPLRFQWDVILSTQVIQYVSNPRDWLADFMRALKPGGKLVLTGPTNWPIVEAGDRWRFTPNGIASLLNDVGFFVEVVQPRASVEHADEEWLLGWGAIGRT